MEVVLPSFEIVEQEIKRIIKILENGKAYDTKIVAVRRGGTRISIEKNKDYRNIVKFKVFIDTKQCYELLGRGIKIHRLINLLIAHELDHARIELQEIEKGTSNKRMRMNLQMLNIAEDYEINWRISMDKRIGIHADLCGFKPFMQWDFYYKKLEEMKIKDPDNFNSLMSRFEPQDSLAELRKELSELTEKELDELKEKLDEIIDSMNSKKGYGRDEELYGKDFDLGLVPPSTKKMIEEISKIGANVSMSIASEELTYFRFSRRSYGGSIILPGLQEIDGESIPQIDKTPTLFIDMSGSMALITDEIINTVKFVTRHNVRVVLYGNEIYRIIEPGEKYSNVFKPVGGNDLEKAYEEYVEKYSELETIMILTDGGEPCLFNDCFSVGIESFEQGTFFDDHPTAIAYVTEGKELFRYGKDSCIKL